MNWTCLVYGLPMSFAIIWWIADAHKWFKGPKVNIEHMMLGREGNVLEGKAAGESSGDEGSLNKETREMGDKKAGELA